MSTPIRGTTVVKLPQVRHVGRYCLCQTYEEGEA